MNGWLSITPNRQEFAFCFMAAFVTGALLLVHRGLREKWPLLPWLTIMLSGATFGLVGSKLMLIPAGRLLAGLAHLQLPPTADKTLLGGLIGGIVGIELARRWLRFDRPVADAYALVLPIATAIGRIGCLLGGCCFGTPSSLPWAIRYGAGSDALDAHVAHGLVAQGAPWSLPVHPLQVYDILLMLGLAAFLYRARPHLKRKGSLFAFYLLAYGLIRFGEEFIREGGSSTFGLKHVQWGLLLGVLIAALFLVTRERSRSCPVSAVERPTNTRTASAVAAVLLVIVVGFGWLTPLERTIVVLHVIPMALVAFFALVPARQRSRFTRGTATLAAGSALLMVGDTMSESGPQDRSSYYSFYASGTSGAYTEVCGSHHRFETGGIGVSRTDPVGGGVSVEYGLRGYLGRDEVEGSGGYRQLYDINPFAQFDWRWVGAGLGLHAGRLDYYGESTTLLPGGHLRLGPRNVVYLEAGFADHVLGGIPQPVVWGGIGHELEDGSSWLFGGGFTGVFLQADIRAADNWRITPFGAYTPGTSPADYQIGLALRYRL